MADGGDPGLHGRPTAAELLEAVREFLAGDVVAAGGRLGFHARVAANAVAIVERELHGRPTAAELLEAVREFLAGDVVAAGGRLGFHARVAANAVAIVERELRLRAEQEAAHSAALARLGVASEAELAAAVRAGSLDDRMAEVVEAVRATVRARLEVANPGYIPTGPESRGAGAGEGSGR